MTTTYLKDANGDQLYDRDPITGKEIYQSFHDIENDRIYEIYAQDRNGRDRLARDESGEEIYAVETIVSNNYQIEHYPLESDRTTEYYRNNLNGEQITITHFGRGHFAMNRYAKNRATNETIKPMQKFYPEKKIFNEKEIQFLEKLNLDPILVTMPPQIYIHHHCSLAIQNILEKHNVPLDDSEKNLIQELKRNQYHDPQYVQDLAEWLDNKFLETPEVKMKLNYIFAVDGFSNHYVHYIDNLKLKMYEEFNRYELPFDTCHLIHVLAVRQMYKEGDVTPLHVYEAIVQVLQQEKRDLLTDLGKIYYDCLGPLKNQVLERIVKPKWKQ